MTQSDEKIALVTGGATGLGAATAIRLKADGFRVVIGDIDASGGTAFADAQGLHFVGHDVADEASWDRVMAEVQAQFGRLDVLVNNAGITGAMAAVSPETTSLSEWRRVFAVNVDGVFLGCRAAIPAMRRTGGGSIINMSSVAGLLATPYATAYGCSKAAVRQLTKSVAQYCAEQRLNIRCNSIHPGNVLTGLLDKYATNNARERGIPREQAIAELELGAPMGQLVQPEDVAGAAAFLASEDARMMTGAQIIVDGGLIHCDSYHSGISSRALAAEQFKAV
jgi:3(or 17)beta-hydroxysteroid dehydrogenase